MKWYLPVKSRPKPCALFRKCPSHFSTVMTTDDELTLSLISLISFNLNLHTTSNNCDEKISFPRHHDHDIRQNTTSPVLLAGTYPSLTWVTSKPKQFCLENLATHANNYLKRQIVSVETTVVRHETTPPSRPQSTSLLWISSIRRSLDNTTW